MFWPNVTITGARTAMLLENSSRLPAGDDWAYEFTWPGERVLAVKHEAGVQLQAVAQRKDLTNRFAVVAATVAKLPSKYLVLDGVIATIEPAQLNAFASRDGGASTASAPILRFIASDLLWDDENDVRQWPLGDRKRRLDELVRETGILIPQMIPSAGDLLEQARQVGAEAVIAKRRQSQYRPFGRTGDWVRVVVQPPHVRRAGAEGRANSGAPFSMGGWQMA